MSTAKVVTQTKTPAAQIVIGGVGAMASRLVAPLVPGGAVGKIGLALAFGVVAGFAPNKGVSKYIKAASLGAGIVQFTEGFSEAIAPTVSNFANSGEPSKLKDLAKKSVGLAAAETSRFEEMLTRARLQSQALNPDASDVVVTPVAFDALGA